MKTCRVCKQTHPSEAFYKRASNSDGLETICKDCCYRRDAAWREEKSKDPEWRKQENARKKRREHWAPESEESRKKRLLRVRENYHKNPEKQRDQVLRRKYGISLEHFDQAFLSQDGKCGICFSPLSPRGVAGAQADHDHATGKFRALLCPDCNKALGGFKDSQKLLQSAIDYLRKFTG